MAEQLLLLLLLLVLLLPVCTAFPSSTPLHFPSFSYSSFHRNIDDFLLLQGDARRSSSSLSSIELSGSSHNTSGRLLYFQPILLSPSLSFSSSFSFSFSVPAHHHGDSLAFVFAPNNADVASPGPLMGVSTPVHNIVAVQLDPVLDVHVDLDNPAPAANLSDLSNALANGERLYAWVDYHGLTKVLEVRLSKSNTHRPDKPLLFHHVDLAAELQNPKMYVGFTSTTGISQQKHIIYMWNFHSWDGAQHSLPVDPAYHHHEGHLHTENAYMRVITLLFAGIVCASTSMLAMWALVYRVFKRAHREIAMLPVMCGYEKIITEENEALQV